MIEICKIFKIRKNNNYIKYKFYFLKEMLCRFMDKYLSENLDKFRKLDIIFGYFNMDIVTF